MPSESKVSIILPVYNRPQYIQRSLESVLAQTFTDFELIIVDDASTDETSFVIKQYSDPRIKMITNKCNQGISYSRNRGIELATSAYIALIDSDDEWLPKKLEKQFRFLQKYPELRVVHTEEIWIRNGKRVNQKKRHKKSGGDIFIRSLELCLMSPSSILLAKEIFNDYGFFDEKLIVCEDYDMWLRISANEKVGFIAEPLIKKYGGHDDQLSKAYAAMDRFRIMSLVKIDQNISLDFEKKKALQNTLLRKANILYQGAVKRNNIEKAQYYKKLISFYQKKDE
ncbi:MAG: glycosyltransferase [Spirochaetes bacterium]|nr:glycosyltransferase [Spirochaetota bacterium]